MANLYIKKVIIKNFMGINDTVLNIPKSGIIKVIGINKDSKNLTSNGTGKTTVFLAILQGLFNKVPDKSLDTINNLNTKLPYYIEIHMTLGEDSYTVINDRNTLKITVLKNDEVVATRIREALNYIEKEILGLSYSEFLLLSRVTYDSLKSIFKVTSSNLLLKLFNLHKLDEYEGKLKKEKARLNTLLRKIISDINKAKFPIINEQELEKENEQLLNKLHLYTTSKTSVSEEIDTVVGILNTLEDQLGRMQGSNCPTCGQPLPLPKDTSKSIEELQEELNMASNKLSTLKAQQRELFSAIDKINQKVQQNKTRLLVAQEFIERDLGRLREEQEQLMLQIKYLEETLEIIATGQIHQHYLSKFLKILNQVLRDNAIEHEVVAYLNKTSIYYSIKTDGKSKTIEQLSGGETTVIALSILSAIFKTIEALIGKNINLLIFDEAIHATDSVSESQISNIVESMDNKSIYIIQHHNEISDSTFTDILKVEKENGVVRIIDGV